MILKGLDIVLVQPQIPFNTGNVGRTCVATASSLHLVKPLGYSLDDRYLKRGGLDYWKDIDLTVHESLDDFIAWLDTSNKTPYLFSRFAQKTYWEESFQKNAVLIFGSEVNGLPIKLKERYCDALLRIPTPGQVRSLNLSTSVGVVLFEALRQIAGH